MTLTIIGNAYVKVAPDTTGFGSKVQKDVVGAMQGTARQAGQILRAGILGATIGIGATAVAGVGIFAGFEQSLNILQATAHATAPEMAAISAQAKKLGADMSLPATSAADAAEAMTALAKGGRSATDSMNAARGALQFAAASGTAVADSALIIAQNLNAFQLAGTDATKVADILTGAYTHSGVSATEFAGALSNVSAVANNNHVSLADTATALATLTRNGVDASSAGTELRAVILRLSAPTGPARKEMDKLGLSFFDAHHNAKPLRAIIDELSVTLKKLNPEQQAAAFEKIFGNRAIGEAIILGRTGTETFDQIGAAIATSGNAADIAGARMKGLSGTLEGVKSVVETIGLDVGQILQPALQGILGSVSGEVQVLNQFADAAVIAFNPARISQFGAIASTVLGDVRSAVKGVEGPIIGIGVALAATFGAGLPLIGAFVPELGIVNGALFGIIATSSQARRALVGFGGDMVQVATQMAPDLLVALRTIQDAVGPAFANVVTGAGEAAKIIGPVLSAAARELSGPLADVILQASRLAQEAFPRLADAAGLVVRVGTSILVPALKLTADVLRFLGQNASVTVPAVIAIGTAFATWKLSKAIADIGLVTKAVKIFKDELAFQKSRAVLESFAGIGTGASTMGTAVAGGAAVARAALGGLATALTNPVFLGFAAGALVLGGLVKGFLDSAAKARALKAEIQSLSDAIVSGGNAIQAATDHLNMFIKSNKDVAIAVAGLKGGTADLGAALQGTDAQFEAVKAQLIAVEIASLHLSGPALDTLNAALKQSGGNMDEFFQRTAQGTDGAGLKVGNFILKIDSQRKINLDAAAAAKIYTDATKGQGDTAEVAAAKIQKIEDALKGVLDATIASFNSQLSYTRAVQGATDAAKALSDAQALMRITGPANADTQRKLTDLTLSAAEALDSQAQAAVRNADDVSKATTKVGLTASQQYAIYRSEVIKAAQANPALADSSNQLLATLDANAARAGLVADSTALQYVQGFQTGIASAVPAGQNAVADYLRAVANAGALASIGLLGIEKLVIPITSGAQKAFEDAKPDLQKAATDTATNAGTAFTAATAAAITATAPAVATAATAAITGIDAAQLSGYLSGYQVGTAAGSGMVAGLDAQRGAIQGKATDIANAAAQAAAAALQVKSPSRVFMAIGQQVGAGLVLGMSQGSLGVAVQSLAMAHQAIDPLYQYLEIASPSKKAQKAGVAVGQGISAGMAATLNSVGKTLDEFRKEVAQGLDEIRGVGQTAYAQMVADAISSQTTAQDFLQKMARDVATKTKEIRDNTTKAAFDLQVLQRASANLNPGDFLAALSLAVDQGVKASTDADQQAKFDKVVADEVAKRLGKPLPSTQTAVDQILHVQQQLFEHNMISAQSFLSTLQGRLTQLNPLTDEYFALLDEINSVNATIATAQKDAADAAAQAAQTAADTASQAFQAQQDALDATIHREQLMYEHQLLAGDLFLADLQARAGQVEQFSDAYFALLDEIARVRQDQTDAAKKTATGTTFLVKVDNNGQGLSEERLAQLLARTQRVTPDAFGRR